MKAVSLVSPFFQDTIRTQHLANGVFQPCAVLRSCRDAEGRIVSPISEEIVLHAVLACILWGLGFEAQAVMFWRAKGAFVGAAGWTLLRCAAVAGPRGEVVPCAALCQALRYLPTGATVYADSKACSGERSTLAYWMSGRCIWLGKFLSCKSLEAGRVFRESTDWCLPCSCVHISRHLLLTIIGNGTVG